MSIEKPRFTLTGTYFAQTKPARTAVRLVPDYPIPANRAYLPRMAWNINPGMRVRVSSATLAASFRDSPLPDAAFFPDTCFLTSPLSREIWESLLTRELILAPLVYRELQDWLAAPHANAELSTEVGARLAADDQHVSLAQVCDQYRAHGFEYYCPLLLLRKLKGHQFAFEFERQHGHPPTKEEFYHSFKSIGPGYDDRAVRLGWKGYTDYEKPNYATDEQLVTMAVIHAMMTGRETTVLTRDHDIMDQFYKLVFLIDTHYRGMLFADRFAMKPESFETKAKREVCEGHPDYFDDRFVGPDDVFVRPNLPPNTMWNDLLPPMTGWVAVACMWFGDGPDDCQVARLSFCADAGMARVLRLKAATGGLNTDRLDGRNCHIWPSPRLGNVLGPCVAIARDRLVDYHPGFPPYRALDMIHAVMSRESFDRHVITGAGPEFQAW